MSISNIVLVSVLIAVLIRYGVAESCTTGTDCHASTGRTYVNGDIYCCTNSGSSPSVSTINSVVICSCNAGGFYSSNFYSMDSGSGVFRNGEQLNPKDSKEQMEKSKKLQAQMHQIHTDMMQQLSQTLSKIFHGLRFSRMK